jgi:hypothetical protein
MLNFYINTFAILISEIHDVIDGRTDIVTYVCYLLLVGKHPQCNASPILCNRFLNFLRPREFRYELVFLYILIIIMHIYIYSVWYANEVASSSVSDVHRYVIMRKSLDSVSSIFPILLRQWEIQHFFFRKVAHTRRYIPQFVEWIDLVTPTELSSHSSWCFP